MAYKIGTRKSLLARTQSGQIKDILEKNHDASFDLEFIITLGDQDQKTPLWQMNSTNVFTRELDTALLNKQTDFNIHSHKDLGSVRPEKLTIGAITKRSFPHDILLIRQETIPSLLNNSTSLLKIGTSSPRREANLKRNLKKIFSFNGPLEFSTLRGNVNTRIEKLKNKQYDIIILAFAGLERLAQVPTSRKELSKLIKDLNFMILPLSLFPGAASQGALAIETRKDLTSKLQKYFQTIHHTQTAAEIKLERMAFNNYGGGCHLPVGIYVAKFENGFIHCHQGHYQNNDINILRLDIPRPTPAKSTNIFIGLKKNKTPNKFKNTFFIFNELISYQNIPYNSSLNDNILITSTNTLPSIKMETFNPKTLWVSGIKTMNSLLRKQHWVNGSGDLFGEQQINEFKKSQFIKLFLKNNKWISVTNDQSKSIIGDTAITYTRNITNVTEHFNQKISDCQIFFWMSFYQYEQYIKKYPFIINAQHCTGTGKTYKHFKKNNIPVIPFINLDEFYNWLGVNNVGTRRTI